MLTVINLLTLDAPVLGPQGIVYSTGPRRGVGFDRANYFVKGPENAIVFAELAGCLLASHVGLAVAPARVCHFGGEMYCGSVSVATIGRDAEPWLRSPATTINFPELFDAVVVDAWLGNGDRNL